MDFLNQQLTRILTERLDLAEQISQVKQAQGLPLHDPDRERQMLETSLAAVVEPNKSPAIKRMLESIFAFTLDYLKNNWRRNQ